MTDEEITHLNGSLPLEDGPYIRVELLEDEVRVSKTGRPTGARKGLIRKSTLSSSKTNPWLVIYNLSAFPELNVSRFYMGPNEGGTKVPPDLPTEMTSVDGVTMLVCRLDVALAA